MSDREQKSGGTTDIPVITVRVSDAQKHKIREEALKTARSMGVTDEEWERHRSRPGKNPHMRDLGMLFDPVRKVEIMRSGK